MSQQIISVGTFIHYLKGKIENDPLARGVFIEGEISNFSNYRSGHWYFSLKDQNAQIKCVMFSSYNRNLNFMPKDGDKVIIRANASVYENRGELQVLVTDIKPSGIGDLYLQYEALKKKLDAQGLFEEAHKKPLPKFPMKIGLVTGNITAARSDVLTTLKRRWPVATVYECNALVQGSESAKQVSDALMTLDRMNLDVILLVRGGGSIEDLFSFNDERLAHVIYQMKTPIVTGIGHEVDFTIADFVADRRAPTPTGAAEIATPDWVQLKVDLEKKKTRMQNAVSASLTLRKNAFEKLKNSRIFLDPKLLSAQKIQQFIYLENAFNKTVSMHHVKLHHRLEQYETQLANQTRQAIVKEKQAVKENEAKLNQAVSMKQMMSHKRMEHAVALLDAYSPLKVLQRGYSITLKDEKVIRDVQDIEVNDQLQVRFASGKATVVVKEKESRDEK